jgi:tetratricopeptide (TPR) repeat protein
VVLLCAAIGGCGGNKSGGPSYDAQIAAARAEPNADVRARKLIVIGYRQGAKSQDIVGAKRVLEFAELACREVPDAEPRASVYVLLGDAQARLGNRSEALKALRDATAAAEQVESGERKTSTLASVAAVYANPLKDESRASDLFTKAAELATAIEDPQSRALAQKDLGKALAKGERNAEAATALANAFTSAQAVTDPYRRCDVLSQVAAAQLGIADQTDAGLATVDAAMETAGTIEKPFSQVYALTDIAKTLIDAKQADRAKPVVEKAVEGLKTIPEADLRSQAEERVTKLRREL